MGFVMRGESMVFVMGGENMGFVMGGESMVFVMGGESMGFVIRHNADLSRCIFVAHSPISALLQTV